MFSLLTRNSFFVLVFEIIVEIFKVFRQAILYLVIGIGAVVIDLGLFIWLQEGMEVNAALANTISIFTAMIFSFLANAFLNFKSTDRILLRFLSFATVTFCGYWLSQAIVLTFTELIGWPGFVGKIISLVPVVVLQYFLNKKITFKSLDESPAEEDESPDQIDVDLSGKNIAVIGGGFTGLASAYRLQKQGAQVTLYEAGSTLGGLAAGFELNDGTPLERAYHFAYKTDKYTIDLATEVGVIDKLNFYPTAIAAIFGNRLYPFNTALDLLRFKPLSLFQRIRTGMVSLRLMLISEWQPLTQITAYEWLCRYNGKEATDIIWKPLLQGKFDTYWDKITMAWLWTRIKVRQESQDSLGKEELGYFDGSFRTLIDAIVTKLEEGGVELKTNTPIEGLDYNQQTKRPTVTVAGKSAEFDSVISTIPSPLFARLSANHPDSTSDYRDKLQSIDYLGAVLMVMVTSEPITSYYWHQIHNDDAPFLVLLSLDSLVGTEKANGNHVYYIGDYVTHDSALFNADEETIRRDWIKGVQDIMPDFEPNVVTESHVFKFKDAQHIVGVGYESKIPDYKTPLSGHYLANFSQIFPEDRGINYALRDGIMVSDLAAADLVGTPTSK